MPSDIRYDKSSGLIEIVLSGEVTGPELREAVQKRIALQRETGAVGVLTDASETQTSPSTMDLFDLPSHLYPEQDQRRRTVIALILPHAEGPKEMAVFLETASRNRGWQMQVFANRQSALAWLKEHAASSKAQEDTPR